MKQLTSVDESSSGTLNALSIIVNTLIDTPVRAGGMGLGDGRVRDRTGELGRVGSAKGKFTVPGGGRSGRFEGDSNKVIRDGTL